MEVLHMDFYVHPKSRERTVSLLNRKYQTLFGRDLLVDGWRQKHLEGKLFK